MRLVANPIVLRMITIASIRIDDANQLAMRLFALTMTTMNLNQPDQYPRQMIQSIRQQPCVESKQTLIWQSTFAVWKIFLCERSRASNSFAARKSVWVSLNRASSQSRWREINNPKKAKTNRYLWILYSPKMYNSACECSVDGREWFVRAGWSLDAR